MRRRKDNTKNLIIERARHQFLANGYTATTVDVIAAEAGITKRTLYGYFENKRTLFLEVIRSAVGNPPDELFFRREIKTRQDIVDMLHSVAAGLNDITTRPHYIQLLRIAIAEIPFQPDVSVLFEQSMAHQSLDWLSAFFAEIDRQGFATIAHPEVLARSFAGSFVIRMVLDGLLRAPSDMEIKPLAEEDIEALVDTFVRGIGL